MTTRDDRDAADYKDNAYDLSEAVRILAVLTKNSPSYEVTTTPFAAAHQEACAVLARLQAAGFEEAS